MNLLDLKGTDILIVSHTFVKGAAQELEEFLIRGKARNLVFIGHPLSYSAKRNSFYKRYSEGQFVSGGEAKDYKFPEIMLYLKDLFYTIYWTQMSGIKFDILVGVNNLNGFACLILKWLGRGKKVIYFTIDYIPRRFENKILNKAYHALDRICVKYCDTVWNVCARMIEGREKAGIPTIYRKKQVTVPIGINFERTRQLSHKEIDKGKVIFLGHLLEKQGSQLLIEAAPMIVSEVPYARFEIIGGGEYEQVLKKLVQKLQVQEYFEFTGLIMDRDVIDRRLMRGAIGVAPYVPDASNFTYYADPTKPKDYMAFGLPVIITDVPAIAQDIDARKAGFMIEYDPKMLAQKVIDLLKDDTLYRTYRENAVSFASEYDWNHIFTEALKGV